MSEPEEPAESADQWMRRILAKHPDIAARFANLQPTPEQVLDYLKLWQQLMPHLIEDREPGLFPLIDAAAPLSERLAMVALTWDVGAEGWEKLIKAVTGVAKSQVGDEVAAFIDQITDVQRAPALAFNNEALEVLRLFGSDVGRVVANSAWRCGYIVCVGRLMLDCELRGTPLPEPATDMGIVQKRLESLLRVPTKVWINAGTHPPLTGDLAMEVLIWWVNEMFRRLDPLVGTSDQSDARTRLLRIAMAGYAIGRAHLEHVVLEGAST